MASIIGYEGGPWLVAVLLILVLGLVGALVRATRGADAGSSRGRRPH